jgi:hypothetical protein
LELGGWSILDVLSYWTFDDACSWTRTFQPTPRRLPAYLQQPTMESSDNHSLGLNRICQ